MQYQLGARDLSDTAAADSVYSSALNVVPAFRFDESVARVFPDMIKRSVPGYSTTLDMIGVITARFAQPSSRLYDLGCSVGASTLAMRGAVAHPNCRVVAVDNSEAMVQRCSQHVRNDTASKVPVDIICDDIRTLPMERASVVTSNFTLQFLKPEDRLPLLRRVCDAMLPGGAFILSEKIHFETGAEQELQTTLHHDFKRANGYSELEISQKRTAIENVLVPDTIAEHHARLEEAGFRHSVVWFQCFSFVSLLAIK
ncbi:MAG: carboxy-S-adenosyl-L-methionine synthase CmoA [Myxococcota bacterium]|nr:carboxy-S-adenosyl-L-methionine synthase CmoA [Myxococcota bacterium]